MSLSRVNSKKVAQKKKRKSRIRRLLWLINMCLAGIIIIVMSVLYRGEQMWETAKQQLRSFGIIQNEIIQNGPNDNDETNKVSELPAAGDDQGNASSETAGELDGDAVTEQEEQLEQPSSPETDTVTLAFVGDILQGEYIQTWLNQEGYSYPFQKAMFHLTTADLTAGNLEMPITTRGVPAEDKTFVFKGAPEGLQGIKDAGIDIVSLANNHTLDQGVEGMLDTMKYLDQYDIKHAGAGNDATEAYKPVLQEINGIKLAYFGITRVVPDTNWKANKYSPGLAEAYDPTLAIQAIEEAEKSNDITIVMIHWGKEREARPEKYQLELAKKFIDAGADLIIGSHPHVLQGFEQYNGKWIAYSLGNFVFAVNPKGKQSETGVLGAICDAGAKCDLTFYPMKIVNAQPTPVEGEEAKEILSFLQEVSISNINIDERGNITTP